MTSITSAKTIEQLRIIFSTHGLPKKVVTDNGPSFTSLEFKQFMKENGVIHITSAPYHPSSNGLAERAVQTFKAGIQRIQGSSIHERLSKFLFKYRITPHTTTGIAPAELLMGRRLRSRLDLLYPDVSRKVENQQQRQKESHDNARPLRWFTEGDRVYAEDFTVSSCKWNPSTIVELTGPLSYTVRLDSGIIVRRHVDNLRRRDAEQSEPTSDMLFEPTGSSEAPESSSEFPVPAPVSQSVPAEPEAVATASTTPREENPTIPEVPTVEVPVPETQTTPTQDTLPPTLRKPGKHSTPMPAPEERRSTRIKRPREWYG
jgi:hypothetical protein